MKKKIQKKANIKKLILLVFAFIGLQLNAQTELTVTDVVEVQNFTLGTGGDLTKTDAAITAGTGSIANQSGYLRIISNGTFADHKSNITFDLKSTVADVTSTITFKFKKRKANTVSGNVTVGGVTTNVTLGSTNAATFSKATSGVSADNGFEDVEVVLDAITLTATAQTIVFNFTEVIQATGTNNPQIRFEEISVNKTAVSGGCTEASDVTTLIVSAGAEYTTLSWTDATCFDEVLVVAKASSAVTVTPTGDGSGYNANTAFGLGDDLGTNEFAVYKGSGTSVTVNGLTKGGTTYHYTVFTRKGTDWSDGAVVNATTNNTYTTITNTNDSNWEDANKWLGESIPSSDIDNVVINTRILINSNVKVNDFTVNERATINAGFSLETNDVTVASGKLLIVKGTSSTFASLIINGASPSSIFYDRFIGNSPNNELVSFPVSGTEFGDFAVESQNENRFFLNPSDATNYFVGPFNNTSGVYETYFTVANDATVMDSGKGYRMATKIGETGTVRFNGAVQTGTVPVSITDGGHATYGQWNLIGNPYPSYIDFDTFFTANTNQFEVGANNAVYGWNGTSYTVWNAATSTDTPGNKLAPGQGFFVKTKDATTGTVNFTPAMRVNGTSNDFLAKSDSKLNVAKAKLNLSSATKTYATDIYFIDNQTKGLDSGYDAGAFEANANGIYTNLVESNTGVPLLIQALPYDDFNNVTVPVAINSEAGEALTISLDKVSLTLPANTYVFLKDNVLNTTTLLNDVDYVFTPDSKLSGSGRFFIQFSAKAVLSADEYVVNDILIYSNQASKSIIIKGILKTEASVKVYDIQGRMVLEQKLDSSNITNVIDANALNTGVYMVQLENRIQKVIIK